MRDPSYVFDCLVDPKPFPICSYLPFYGDNKNCRAEEKETCETVASIHCFSSWLVLTPNCDETQKKGMMIANPLRWNKNLASGESAGRFNNAAKSSTVTVEMMPGSPQTIRGILLLLTSGLTLRHLQGHLETSALILQAEGVSSAEVVLTGRHMESTPGVGFLAVPLASGKQGARPMIRFLHSFSSSSTVETASVASVAEVTIATKASITLLLLQSILSLRVQFLLFLCVASRVTSVLYPP
ncbi:hypothetical protein Ancab_006955 [Ancistrocladus abbreviatus]